MPLFIKKIFYAVFDLVGAAFAIIFIPLFKLNRSYKSENFPLQLKLFKWLGVFPIRDHYYEPKFNYEADFDASSIRDLPLSLDIETQLIQLQVLERSIELEKLTLDKNGNEKFFVHNPNFGAGDAELYYLSLIHI